MRTDSHLYALFRECPQFIFELAGIPSPGPCRMEQVMVTVFKPVLERSEAVIEKQAAAHYHRLKTSRLSASQRRIFLSVFIDWLSQRFENRSSKDIKTMIAEFVGIENTALGREMIGIGVERGRKQGMRQGMEQGMQRGRGAVLRNLIAAKFGKAAAPLSDRLDKLSTNDLDTLAVALLEMKKVAELRAWLAGK